MFAQLRFKQTSFSNFFQLENSINDYQNTINNDQNILNNDKTF
jgi:hypothetical protein